MSRIIGIDLGTTNSCAAVMDGGKPVIIPNGEGGRTTPSVVAFTQSGERLVGQPAVRQELTNSEQTIRSIKREMGSPQKVPIGDRTFSPPEISAIILAKLKRDAEAFLGEPVSEAVITVPAYFTDAQRQATKDAGTIAGLTVRRIINEPTAAALAYGVDKEESQKVLVFDLGGGTFDVSLLEIKNGVIEVCATAGNNRLGGDDFNACVAEHLAGEFKRETGVDVRKEPVAMLRIKEAAEQAKKELSASEETQINLPYLCEAKGSPKHLQVSLTRAQFDKLTSHLVDATEAPVRQVIEDAHITKDQIGKVLLVGGSTRVPAVQEKILRITGKPGFKGINPDECVAVGAALQAGVLVGEVTSLLLLDVTPLSLGIETVGGMCAHVIQRNTTIPISKSRIFTTAAPFQPSVEINVLQGERPRANQNKSLGKFRLKGIQRAMAGVPQIEVTFTIDANGIVNVSAKDLKTGKAQEITIEASSNMSEAELRAAIHDAERYAAEDAQFRKDQDAQGKLQTLILRAEEMERAAIKNKDKERFKKYRETFKGPVKEAKKALNGKDAAVIYNAIAGLETLITELENKSAG